MLSRIVLCVAVGMALAGNTKADSMYDYAANVDGWNIVGWTDTAQISCGAATEPTIADKDYFSIYRQIWPSNALVPGSSTMSYWDMTIGTTIPQGNDVWVTVNVGDKFHAALPESGGVSNTTNPHVRVLSLDTEACAFEPGCTDKPDNLILHALAAELDNAKTLRLSFSYKGGHETRTVGVSDFKAVKAGINKCFRAISSRLSKQQP